MIDRVRLATGTAEVLASLRRSLAGDGVTVPLPPAGVERDQTLALLRTTDSIEDPDAAVVVATSGSTGRPRGVVLSRASLLASAAATEHRLGGPGHWVLALPPHYVAGLMVLVRAVVAGRPALEVDGRLTDLARRTGPSAGDDRRYLSLVPTQLVRALDDPLLVAALSGQTAVLLGGGAADPGLLTRARAAGISIVTTYGMSETCGGCVYDGVPLDGVEVDLEPETGRISIDGPVLFSGYLGSARRPAGPWRTGDRGRRRNGRLEVLGRLDAVVVSGGRNVDVDAVERELRRRSGRELVVVALPDPEWGARVVAVGVGELDDALGRLGSALPEYARPRQWISVGELPRTAGGKVDRQRLVRELSSGMVP